jgi:hypothetical protein
VAPIRAAISMPRHRTSFRNPMRPNTRPPRDVAVTQASGLQDGATAWKEESGGAKARDPRSIGGGRRCPTPVRAIFLARQGSPSRRPEGRSPLPGRRRWLPATAAQRKPTPRSARILRGFALNPLYAQGRIVRKFFKKSCPAPLACGSLLELPHLTKRRQSIGHDRSYHIDSHRAAGLPAFPWHFPLTRAIHSCN